MSRKIWSLLSLLLVLSLVFTGCQQTPPGDTEAEGAELTFYVVSHGGPGDPFWGVVMQGMEDAARHMNVNATYSGPEKYSVDELVNLLNSAIAARPDGIAVTMTDPAALDEPLRRAIEQGIPVVAVNVPDLREEPIPYMFYVGGDEYLGGVFAAERMLEERTPQRAVCAIHEVGHSGLETRCRGFSDVMTEAGVTVDKLDIGVDPTVALETISSYLIANSDTDAIFTLGSLGAEPVIKYIRDEGLQGELLHGSYDLHEGTLNAIQEGITLFTIDQQQYLQGYMPIVWLTLYNQYQMEPANDLLTGPAIVDASNVDPIADLIKAGYR
ncbi:MAG: sugar ABC transporter substrate-binding protein [Anaerolineales bacterium]